MKIEVKFYGCLENNIMMERDFNYKTDNPILQKHREVLRKLAIDSRVVCICSEENNNGFYLRECCDEYFTHNLTKVECLELSELFNELADTMK